MRHVWQNRSCTLSVLHTCDNVANGSDIYARIISSVNYTEDRKKLAVIILKTPPVGQLGLREW